MILADVTLGADGNIDLLDCFAHRRYVALLAEFYFVCSPLRIRAVRLTDSRGNESAELNDLSGPLSLRSDRRFSVIEAAFDTAVKPATVTADSFKVEPLTAGLGVPNGTVEFVADRNAGRWRGRVPFAEGRYRVTVVGTGASAITSDRGSPLDGEPTQLPSGDGCPGGDFRFEFEIVPER